MDICDQVIIMMMMMTMLVDDGSDDDDVEKMSACSQYTGGRVGWLALGGRASYSHKILAAAEIQTRHSN